MDSAAMGSAGLAKGGESGGDQALGNEGFNRLARTLQNRMQEVGKQPLSLDFGSINGDYSLKTNTFPLPIPATDYQVCRTLTYGKLWTWLTNTQDDTGIHPHGSSGEHEGHTSGEGKHEHPDTEGGHLHPVLIPPKMQSLKPGDRVIVAWIGNDAVVIDIVYPAAEVM